MNGFEIFMQLVKLLVFDAIVAAVFILICLFIKQAKCASFAVLKRDFVGYFSNPTGYVFICVFMLLGSCCAFWPEEFFNRNLATLDQLNQYLPFIMLVFVPAITMSVWSEERREGTDELLLTIPAERYRHCAGQVPGGRRDLFGGPVLFATDQFSGTAAVVLG